MQPSGAVQDALWLGCQVSDLRHCFGHGGSCCEFSGTRSVRVAKGQVTEVSEVTAEGRIWLQFPRQNVDWPEMFYLELETKY